MRRVDGGRFCRNALSRRVHQALNGSRISLGSRSPATMTCTWFVRQLTVSESPPPHPAMIGNGQFDEPALVLVEKAGIFPQAGLPLAFASGIGKLPTVAVLDPPATHRRAAKCHTLARSEKRPRVRAKAVCNHVSLCFSSVSRAHWSIDVPSHNVTHQPDTPATGPSAGNPACSGLSNRTDLPTRQQGSEALPSLARRVSMRQHAKLPCRGNTARPNACETSRESKRLAEEGPCLLSSGERPQRLPRQR